MAKAARYQNRIELLQGTLDLLILQTLQLGPQHGYGIAQFLLQRSDKVLSVGEGSLYPALQRLLANGWAEAEWQHATNQQGLSQFTAEPSVDLRPAPSGVEIIGRYVTRAADRFATRNRLYQTVLDLMYNEEETPAVTAGEKQAK